VVDTVGVDRPISTTILTDKAEEFADPQSIVTYTGLGPVFFLEETAETRAAYFSGPPLTEHPQKTNFAFADIIPIFLCPLQANRFIFRTFRSCLFSRHGISFRKIGAAYINLLGGQGRER
jgi:hypothetical protein